LSFAVSDFERRPEGSAKLAINDHFDICADLANAIRLWTFLIEGTLCLLRRQNDVHLDLTLSLSVRISTNNIGSETIQVLLFLNNFLA